VDKNQIRSRWCETEPDHESHPHERDGETFACPGYNRDQEAPREFVERLKDLTAKAGAAKVGGGNGLVQIAYLHGETVSHSFHESLRSAWEYDIDVSHDRERLAPKPLNLRTTSGRIVQSRNFGTALFLDKTPHEWMMWIDTDMGFERDAIHRLLKAADPVERPIVGGLCFATYAQEGDGMGGYRSRLAPTMYQLGTKVGSEHESFCFYGPYERDTMCRVAATGAAFLLIHRSVLEDIREKHGNTWWNEVYDRDGDIVGEDLSFCLRALDLGKAVYVHTGVSTTHHKGQWIGEEDYLFQESTATIEVLDGPESLPPHIDVPLSLLSLANNDHDQDGMLKLRQDLERYREIIESTLPEVIVETGTHRGGSARWFRDEFGVDVITVDIAQNVAPELYDPAISYVTGDSVHERVVDFVTSMVAGRRCMVILDSDHSAKHVAAEIAAYGPLVSVGCYLVVEDTIFGFAGPRVRAQHFPAGLQGSPLDAVEALLVTDRGHWGRDISVERLSQLSHHPAGWWVRTAEESVEAPNA
jgi:cephalosporin hydroxylase